MENTAGLTPVNEVAWEELAAGPRARLDAAAFQIGERLYCVGGYISQEQVASVIDIFDLAQRRWVEEMPLPPTVPQSHASLACESDRYLYLCGGQVGPRCSPATSNCFTLDLHRNAWGVLPSLPEPRYSPTMQLYQGRLHLIGGSKPDRYTPVRDHLSLAVAEGRALETAWRVETPIPRGGMHRTSALVNGRMFVFGGQSGDFVAIPGDPMFSCTGRTVELIYPDSYQWDETRADWIRLADMPIQSSHMEFSQVVIGDLVVICGGSCYKDPETFDIQLTDAIQLFDTTTGAWRIAGRLPFRLKTCSTAFYDGWLYVSGGQRDSGPDDPRPGAVVGKTFRAKLFNQDRGHKSQ